MNFDMLMVERRQTAERGAAQFQRRHQDLARRDRWFDGREMSGNPAVEGVVRDALVVRLRRLKLNAGSRRGAVNSMTSKPIRPAVLHELIQDVHAEKICDEWVGPVSRAKKSRKEQLDGVRLPHSGTRAKAWPTWQRLSGVSTKGSIRVDYEHFYLCVQAAVSGLGMAMVSFLMVQDELQSGQLHTPYGFIRDGSGYCLLSPQPLDQDEKCARFKAWLMAEAAASLSAIGV